MYQLISHLPLTYFSTTFPTTFPITLLFTFPITYPFNLFTLIAPIFPYCPTWSPFIVLRCIVHLSKLFLLVLKCIVVHNRAKFPFITTLVLTSPAYPSTHIVPHRLYTRCHAIICCKPGVHVQKNHLLCFLMPFLAHQLPYCIDELSAPNYYLLV